MLQWNLGENGQSRTFALIGKTEPTPKTTLLKTQGQHKAPVHYDVKARRTKYIGALDDLKLLNVKLPK